MHPVGYACCVQLPKSASESAGFAVCTQGKPGVPAAGPLSAVRVGLRC
jgi:hypothetical protein